MNSFAEMLGISTSENKTCFLGTTDEGMAIMVNGKDYFYPTGTDWNCWHWRNRRVYR